jgi:hypothetical protein
LGIGFKDAPEWAAAYARVKATLARREHLPNGAEMRLKRARSSKTLSRRNGKSLLC